MRTRRSPRNQAALWRALGGTPPAPATVPQVPRCWDCREYPAGGRSTGLCRANGLAVAGITAERTCFRPARRKIVKGGAT